RRRRAHRARPHPQRGRAVARERPSRTPRRPPICYPVRLPRGRNLPDSTMARALKVLLVIVAGLVAIAVLAAVALILFFDPNDYRDEIAAQVEKATGRELTIAGDL